MNEIKKSKLVIVMLILGITVFVVSVVLLGLAMSGENYGIPAPFAKAKAMALKQPEKVSGSGTSYHRLDLIRGDIIICFGYDGRSIWIISNQWNGIPIAISYYEKEKILTVTVYGYVERKVDPGMVDYVIGKAFEVFRKAVELKLI